VLVVPDVSELYVLPASARTYAHVHGSTTRRGDDFYPDGTTIFDFTGDGTWSDETVPAPGFNPLTRIIRGTI
jgi:hypothetical protein